MNNLYKMHRIYSEMNIKCAVNLPNLYRREFNEQYNNMKLGEILSPVSKNYSAFSVFFGFSGTSYRSVFFDVSGAV